jgi:diguanylate cyclase (GGDEF)-like protein
VARFGGDEFAVLLDMTRDPLLLAQRMVDALEEPFVLKNCVVRVSLSVGVAVAQGRTGDQPGAVAQQLLHNADTAMYAAKRSGGGAAVLWSGHAVEPAPVAG